VVFEKFVCLFFIGSEGGKEAALTLSSSRLHLARIHQPDGFFPEAEVVVAPLQNLVIDRLVHPGEDLVLVRDKQSRAATAETLDLTFELSALVGRLVEQEQQRAIKGARQCGISLAGIGQAGQVVDNDAFSLLFEITEAQEEEGRDQSQP